MFAIYCATLSPETGLEYSGYFSTAAMYSGISMPAGFPLWSVWGWIFVRLIPFSNVAWRLAIATSLAGALACGVIAHMIARERNALCGSVAAMVFGLSTGIWPRAVLAGPWTLSILLLCTVLALLLQWSESPDSVGWLLGATGVYGLLLTESQIELAVAPAMVFFILLHGHEIGARALWAIVPFLAGLTPVFLLPIMSMTNPPANWFYPRTVEGFYHTLKRQQFGDIQLTNSFSAFVSALIAYLRDSGKGIGWPALVVSASAVVLIKHLRPAERKTVLALTPMFLSTVILLLFVLNPTADRQNEALIMPYYAISWVFLALLMGFGMTAILRAVSARLD